MADDPRIRDAPGTTPRKPLPTRCTWVYPVESARGWRHERCTGRPEYEMYGASPSPNPEYVCAACRQKLPSVGLTYVTFRAIRPR